VAARRDRWLRRRQPFGWLLRPGPLLRSVKLRSEEEVVGYGRSYIGSFSRGGRDLYEGREQYASAPVSLVVAEMRFGHEPVLGSETGINDLLGGWC